MIGQHLNWNGSGWQPNIQLYLGMSCILWRKIVKSLDTLTRALLIKEFVNVPEDNMLVGMWQHILVDPFGPLIAIFLATLSVLESQGRHREPGSIVQCNQVQHCIPCGLVFLYELSYWWGHMGNILQTTLDWIGIYEFCVFLLLGCRAWLGNSVVHCSWRYWFSLYHHIDTGFKPTTQNCLHMPEILWSLLHWILNLRCSGSLCRPTLIFYTRWLIKLFQVYIKNGCYCNCVFGKL